MTGPRFYRVKPARVRIWHAAESWSLDDGGVTLCRRPFGSLDDRIIRADEIELVECDECRVVLENRARRLEAETVDERSERLIAELQEFDAGTGPRIQAPAERYRVLRSRGRRRSR